MNVIAVINIARQQLGMADADYRAMLVRVTGRSSLRAMTPGQHRAVLEEMKRLGFRVKVGSKKLPKVSKPYVRKLFQQWYEAHRAGAIDNRSTAALRAFCRRCLARGQEEVIVDPDLLSYDQASVVIEALKSMTKRAAG